MNNRYISLLIKPASSLCNLRCRYCFYEDVSGTREIPSYGIMEWATAEKVIERALDWAGEVAFSFQGGEPTLAGLPFLERFVRRVQEKQVSLPHQTRVHYSLQTNGMLLDERWCAFLRDNHFLVGLSQDGSARFHNSNRIDPQGNGTFSRIQQARALLNSYGVPYNILWVLTQEQSRFPEKAWKFICEQDLRYVQFIPCMGPLAGDNTPQALTPQGFCQFYSGLYPLWEQAFRRGTYRSIKFFDDLFQLILHGRITACGMTGHCQMQFVVESNGDVYPCDFYVLDQWRCGNICKDSVEELLTSREARDFLERSRQLPPRCGSCRWQSFCGGGCERMRRHMYVTPQGNYCGYAAFLDSNDKRLESTARFIRDHYGKQIG